MNQTQTAPQQIRLNYRAKEACKYLSIGLSTLWLYVLSKAKLKPTN